MKTKWFLAAAMTTAFALPAVGQIHVYLGGAPPPVRYERRPPPPGEGYTWVDGYWGDQGGRYVWVPGRWNQPPYPGAYWSHPHYDHYQEGWRMHDGHWDREDHGDRRDDHRDDHHDDHGRPPQSR